MKCRQFETLLPEWITGRLSAKSASDMEAHHASCPDCRRAAASERALFLRWQELPQAPELDALWPRLAQRIDRAPQRRRSPFRPALTMGSMVGMVAAACLLSIFLRPNSPGDERAPSMPHPPMAAHVDIVQMVSQVQQLPEGESDAFFAETQQDRRDFRRVLSGKEGAQ